MAQIPLTQVVIKRNGQGTAAPTAGDNSRGDIVWNLAPVSGQPIGWVCIAAGTPGTWLGFGVVQ